MTTFMVNSSGKILRLLPGKNGGKIFIERDPRTGQTRLTNNPEVDTVPDWQPLPSNVTICHKPGTPA